MYIGGNPSAGASEFVPKIQGYQDYKDLIAISSCNVGYYYWFGQSGHYSSTTWKEDNLYRVNKSGNVEAISLASYTTPTTYHTRSSCIRPIIRLLPSAVLTISKT